MSTQVQAKNNYWCQQTCNIQYTCTYWWLEVCQHQYMTYKLSIQCFHFLYFSQPGPSEKQEVLVPNTLDDEGFQVVLNKNEKRNVEGVWKEAAHENHCYWKVISHFFTYNISYLKY